MATGITRKSQSYEKHLTCPVCMDLLAEPRALPCMHTFCEKCLHSFIISVCKKGTERGFDCAVCRRFTRPPFKGLHPYSWAENFPLNFALKGIIDEVKRKSIGSLSENDVSKCTSHPDKPIDFICEDHQTLVCSVCAVVNHRQCKQVHYMEGIISVQVEADNTKIENHERKKNSSGTDNTDTNNVPRQVLEASASGIAPKKHQSITRLCKSSSLDSGIDSRPNTSSMKENLVREFASARVIADDGTSNFSDGSELSTSFKRPLSRVCGQTRPKSFDFDSDATQQLDNEIVGTENERPVLERGLSRHGYNSYSLGNLNDIIEEEEEIIVVNVDNNVSKSQIQLVGEHYMRSQTDEGCCSITGMASMPDGRVLVADENNLNVKLFDVNGVFLAQIDLNCQPWDVTAIEHYEGAVTCPNAKCIEVFLVHDTVLSSTKTIDVGKKCYGVSSFKGDLFVACDNEVRVINYKGEMLHRIISEHCHKKKKLFKLQLQKPLFRGARYVCYDGSALAGLIHVSDGDKSCVTALDRKGGVMSKMRLGDGGAPMGVSLGEKGQMFVCQQPNRLVTISIGEHGNTIKPLTELDNIQSAHYNRTSKLLWVSRRMNNFVKVYSVKK